MVAARQGLALMAVIALLLTGCGSEDNSGGGYGAITAHAVWPGDSGAMAPMESAFQPFTAPANVESIVAAVSGGGLSSPVSKTFDATPSASGSGSIGNVPAGGPYTVTLTGYTGNNGTGTAAYTGTVGGVTVTSNNLTDAGAIGMTFSHGGLDTSWGATGSGYTIDDGGGNPAQGNAVLVDSSTGKIYVIGQSESAAHKLTVWRFLSDGTLDTANWGNPNGYIQHLPAGATLAEGLGGVITSAGLVVVGKVSLPVDTSSCTTGAAGPRTCMALWRFSLGNGAIDTSFGDTASSGIAIHIGEGVGTGSATESVGYSVIEDTSSSTTPKKLIIAGYSNGSGGPGDMTLWRYNPSASTPANRWDATFCKSGACGTGGYVRYSDLAGLSTTSQARALAMDGTKVAVVGGQSGSGGTSMTFWRYNNVDSGGGFDVLETGGGSATYYKDPGTGVGYSIALASTKYVILGWDFGANELNLWRFNHPTAGQTPTFDSSFNSGAVVTSSGGGTSAQAKSMAIDSSGRIVAVGQSVITAPTSLNIWRFTSSGAVDGTFGILTQGYSLVSNSSVSGAGGNDYGYGVGLDASDNIYVTGQSDGSGAPAANMGIWKFRP